MLTDGMMKGQATNMIGNGEDDKNDEVINSIVDESLADIVLVKKNEMEEW